MGNHLNIPKHRPQDKILLTLLVLFTYLWLGAANAQVTDKIPHTYSGTCLSPYKSDRRQPNFYVRAGVCDNAIEWTYVNNQLSMMWGTSKQCLVGGGAILYTTSCDNTSSQLRWGWADGRFRNEATGTCLSSNGSTVSLSSCNSLDLAQQWTYGPSVVNSALACYISSNVNQAGASSVLYASATGVMVANRENAAQFTLGRLAWGKFLSNDYVIKSDQNGGCVHPAGGIVACNILDKEQRYSIRDSSGTALAQWITSHAKFNPLTFKKATDIFDNSNKILPRTLVASDGVKPLFVGYKVNNFGEALYESGVLGGFYSSLPDYRHEVKTAAGIECQAYSDQNARNQQIKIIDNYVLGAHYIQQEGSRALREALAVPLTAAENDRIANYWATYPTLPSTRSLKFYDMAVETSTDPILFDIYRDDYVALYNSIVNDLLVPLMPNLDQFSVNVMNEYSSTLQAMESGIAATPLHTIRGRSLLESGGSMTGGISLQSRIRYGLTTPLKRLPNAGNIRISFPAVGAKANSVNGSDPNHSYADFITQKNDGVFNYVVSLELDWSAINQSWPLNTLLGKVKPQVDAGVEIHFAISYRANGNGAKARVDSISVNGLADLGAGGGLAGIFDRMKSRVQPEIDVFRAANREVELGQRPSSLQSTTVNVNEHISINTNAVNLPATSTVDAPGFSGISSHFNTPGGPPYTISASATPQVDIVRNITDAIDQTRWQVDNNAFRYGLFSLIGELSVGIKWMNRSFADEASCRYNNPNDTTCKLRQRVAYSFTPYPNVLETAVHGIVSSQLNTSAKKSNLQFRGANDLAISLGFVTGRVQLTSSSTLWLAFDAKSADAMRAGAALATRAAE